MTHTINTVSLSLNIARRFGLDERTQEDIYLGALLHDVGKIAIPMSILESPGKLSDDEMTIMRTHVAETEALIKDIVPDNICQIAVRHHEKLDGSGYPHGLKADQLSFPQRIVAVADIVSALSNRRSYKEPFPEEKTVAVLRGMAGRLLDVPICQYVSDNYAAIMESTEPERAAVIAQYRSIMEEYDQLQKK